MRKEAAKKSKKEDSANRHVGLGTRTGDVRLFSTWSSSIALDLPYRTEILHKQDVQVPLITKIDYFIAL